MLHKATVTKANGCKFSFFTQNENVAGMTGVWARHEQACCTKILPDVQLFANELEKAEVSEYQPDANKVYSV